VSGGSASLLHAGLLVMIVGFAGTWYTLYHYGVTTIAWATAPAVFVAGFGWGSSWRRCSA
jgi:hypothetical protein